MPWRTSQANCLSLNTGLHAATASSSGSATRSSSLSRRFHVEHSGGIRAASSPSGQTNSSTCLTPHSTRSSSTKICALSVAHTDAAVHLDNVKFQPSYLPHHQHDSPVHGEQASHLKPPTSEDSAGKHSRQNEKRGGKSKLQLIKEVEKTTKQLLGKRAKVWKQKAVPKRLSPARLNHVLNRDDTTKLVHKFHDLSTEGHLDAALRVAEKLSRLCAADVLEGKPNAWDRVIHKLFLRQAQQQKAVDAALHFIHLLPDKYADKRTFSMVMSVCSAAGNSTVALAVADLAQEQGITLDAMHFTNLITACGQQGLAEHALKLYNELRQKHERSVDPWVYCALINAFARSIEKQPAHDSKQRLVLLERAFGIMEEALKINTIHITAPAFNALLNCAVHCDQSERAFKVLDLMQFHGVRPTCETFGALVEVCVRAKQPKLGLRMFNKAIHAGFDKDVKLYTLALRTCMVESRISAADLQRGLAIYRTAVEKKVVLDDLFWGQFLALLGRARRVDLCMRMLSTYLKQLPNGRTPSTPVVSAIMSCCMRNCNHYSAHLVYQLARSQGVVPSVQQYNRLMYCYARERRLATVVSLACDMLQAGLQPTPVTFAVLLGACEKTDQVELAFELVANMKERSMSVEMMHLWILAKLCFNRIRYSWYPPMSHPGSRFHGPVRPAVLPGQAIPTVYIPVVRRTEAQQLLAALGCAHCDTVGAATSAAFGTHRKARRTGLPGQTANAATPPSLDFLGAGSSTGHWSSRLLGVYREAVSCGLKPSLKLLDRILACLRLQFKGARGPGVGSLSGSSTAEHSSAGGGFMPSMPLELARSLPFITVQPVAMAQSKYEVPFSTRAFSIVEDAISQDVLPSFALDSPVTMDLRHFGPTLAEVYVLYIFHMLERRASWGGKALNHPIALLVPAWDPDLVMWPHLVPRLNHQSDNASPTILSSSSTTNATSSHLNTASDELEVQSASGHADLAVAHADVVYANGVHAAERESVAGQSPVEKMMRSLMARNVPGSGLGKPLSSHDWSHTNGSYDEEVGFGRHLVNGNGSFDEEANVMEETREATVDRNYIEDTYTYTSTADGVNGHTNGVNGHTSGVNVHTNGVNGHTSGVNGHRMDQSTQFVGTSNGARVPASVPAEEFIRSAYRNGKSIPVIHADALQLEFDHSPLSDTPTSPDHSAHSTAQHTSSSDPTTLSPPATSSPAASAEHSPVSHSPLLDPTPLSPPAQSSPATSAEHNPISHSPSSSSPPPSSPRTLNVTSSSSSSAAAATSPSTSTTSPQSDPPATPASPMSRTGLAIAATLKRMKIRASSDPETGLIVLDPIEVNRWARSKIKYDSQVKHQPQQPAPGFPHQFHQVVGPKPWLMEQQRSIRLGMEMDAGLVGRPPKAS